MSTLNKIAGAVVLLVLGGAAGWGLSTWSGGHFAAPTETAGAAGTAAERKGVYRDHPLVPPQRSDKPRKPHCRDSRRVTG